MLADEYTQNLYTINLQYNEELNEEYYLELYPHPY